jgi:hypothetical protein
MFVGQLEQIKEEQEPAAAEVKQSRRKSEIQEYVDENSKVDGGFALGLSISVLNLIWEEIMFFGE